jgi:hypothetical protein
MSEGSLAGYKAFKETIQNRRKAFEEGLEPDISGFVSQLITRYTQLQESLPESLSIVLPDRDYEKLICLYKTGVEINDKKNKTTEKITIPEYFDRMVARCNELAEMGRGLSADLKVEFLNWAWSKLLESESYLKREEMKERVLHTLTVYCESQTSLTLEEVTDLCNQMYERKDTTKDVSDTLDGLESSEKVKSDVVESQRRYKPAKGKDKTI